MLGVTREAVNKRMMILTQEQLIETRDGFLILTDLDRLAKRGE